MRPSMFEDPAIQQVLRDANLTITYRRPSSMTLHVTVYTKPACPQCHATTKKLREIGIEPEIEPITDAVLLAARELDLGSAPIVVFDVIDDGVKIAGDQWGGYRPDRINDLKQYLPEGAPA